MFQRICQTNLVLQPNHIEQQKQETFNIQVVFQSFFSHFIVLFTQTIINSRVTTTTFYSLQIWGEDQGQIHQNIYVSSWHGPATIHRFSLRRNNGDVSLIGGGRIYYWRSYNVLLAEL